MKNLFLGLAILVWIGGMITAIVLGSAAHSFLLSLLYILIAFIAGALYFAIYKIQDNQDTIMERIGALSGEIGRRVEKAMTDSHIAPTAPKAAPIPAVRTGIAPAPSNWKCVCGRENPSYNYNCACGRSKTEVLIMQSKAAEQEQAQKQD